LPGSRNGNSLEEIRVDVYRTEEEQVEAIKAWWRENGRSAVFGVVLGLAAIFGWRGWQAWETARAEAASALYEEMLGAMRDGKPGEAGKAGEKLASEYAGTAYAVFARLTLAGLAVDAKDLAAAAEHLRKALEHNEDPALETEISLRLARVLAARSEFDAALALITNPATTDSYRAAIDELRGDIEAARGNLDAAREAYGKARSGATGAPDELLELKLESLGSRADS
jgi:predicted negative regulator of RcsB-dependent stress response